MAVPLLVEAFMEPFLYAACASFRLNLERYISHHIYSSGVAMPALPIESDGAECIQRSYKPAQSSVCKARASISSVDSVLCN